MHIVKTLSEFVKVKRKEVDLTQLEFSERSGFALTVIRKIEQGKQNENLEKVNQFYRCLVMFLPVSAVTIYLYPAK